MFWGNLALQLAVDDCHSSGYSATQGAKWIARISIQLFCLHWS
jgi:hypothetical protein